MRFENRTIARSSMTTFRARKLRPTRFARFFGGFWMATQVYKIYPFWRNLKNVAARALTLSGPGSWNFNLDRGGGQICPLDF